MTPQRPPVPQQNLLGREGGTAPPTLTLPSSPLPAEPGCLVRFCSPSHESCRKVLLFDDLRSAFQLFSMGGTMGDGTRELMHCVVSSVAAGRVVKLRVWTSSVC